MEIERKTKLAIHWKQALIEVIKLDPSLIGSRPDLITGNVQIRLRPTWGLSLVAWWLKGPSWSDDDDVKWRVFPVGMNRLETNIYQLNIQDDSSQFRFAPR